MKKWISVPLLACILVLLGMDICIIDGMLYPVRNLGYTVNEGGGVTLTWSPPLEYVPDGYYVYLDGDSAAEVMDTFYEVTTPAARIEVTNYIGAEESPDMGLDFAALETPNVTIWSISDPSPDHPSGFGFAFAGTATAYSVARQPEEIDYWLWQGDDNSTPALMSPSEHDPPYNAETNGVSQEQGPYFDLKIVSPASQYSPEQAIVQNAFYGLEFSGADSLRHYAKVEVVALEAQGGVYKAYLRLACQTASGLRWVVTE